MTLVVADRVKETTTTTGTGTVTLAGAVVGFQSFAVVGDGNTTYYTITSAADWEVGLARTLRAVRHYPVIRCSLHQTADRWSTLARVKRKFL